MEKNSDLWPSTLPCYIIVRLAWKLNYNYYSEFELFSHLPDGWSGAGLAGGGAALSAARPRCPWRRHVTWAAQSSNPSNISKKRDVFFADLLFFNFSGKTSLSRRFLSFLRRRNIVRQVNHATLLRSAKFKL